MEFILLFILFNILSGVDYYLTKRILKLGGRERSPVMKFLGLLPAKIGGSILGGLLGYFIHWVILILPSMALAGVCVYNYYQLEKIKND